MTKSDVGLSSTSTLTNNTAMTSGQTFNNKNSNTTSSTNSTTQPEIPIWVSDRKKWVTGISKKTTINDIIYAILKQCHINCEYEYINDYVLVEIMYSLTNDHPHHHHHHHHPHHQQQNDNHLQNQQNFIINSERILKGNSKVYKYLSKWIENSNKLILKVKKCELVLINDDNSCNALNASLSSASSSATTNNDNTLDTTITGVNNSNTNTITKFFKKLTNVNNNNNNSNNNGGSSSNNNNNNSSSNKINNLNTAKHVIKYVDVKLPIQQHQQIQQQQQFSNQNQIPQSQSQIFINNINNQSTLTRVNKAGIVPIASLQQQQQQQQQQVHQYYPQQQQINNEYELEYDQPIQQQQQQHFQYQQPKTSELPLPYKQYDPTLQKTLVVSGILDKDKKLNQQFERVKLLDELIKEAEKTLVMNENYYLSNQQFIETQTQQLPFSTTTTQSPLTNKNLSDLNLNDIYSCFPEMYTHSGNEVEEFQLMCKKLLSLDDSFHQQKQILNKLEFDVQKELTINNNQISNNNNNNTTNQLNENLDDLLQISTSLLETPETVKLKKEVNLSREQTRIQCKELHDLDLRMRQNESLLIHKENELKTLLEELYLHEIYLDSVNNTNNNNNNTQNTSNLIHTNNSSNCINELTSTSLSYLHKTATLTSTASSSATNSKLKTLSSNTGTTTLTTTNTMLSSSSTSTSSQSSTTSSASFTPPLDHLINKTTIMTSKQQQQQQQLSPLPLAPPPPLPTTLPPTVKSITNTNTSINKTNDHCCDNDSGISSMSSENDPANANTTGLNNKIAPNAYLQIQQSVKSVMETLV